MVGEDVHRGQLARQAFADETPSIAGKGGSSGAGVDAGQRRRQRGLGRNRNRVKRQSVPDSRNAQRVGAVRGLVHDGQPRGMGDVPLALNRQELLCCI